MRSFRDRNPYLVGLVSAAILGVIVLGAFSIGLFHVFENTYTVKAVFNDASGISAAANVRVAGVRVGRVTKVEADRSAGNVVVSMVVNHDVRLSARNTKAEISLATLLGAKYVRLSGTVTAPYLHDLDAARRVIPVERTKTPFDVFELAKVATHNIEATDTNKLNQLIKQLGTITEGKQAQVAELFDGLNKVGTAISARDLQLRDLLDQADKVSGTLADKDRTLVSLLDQSQAVLDLVARRRADIAHGLESTDVAVGQLAGILSTHKTEIDSILDTLHPTVDILDRRQADLDRTLTYLGPGALGLARATVHGPWADIYVRSLGPGLIGFLQQLQGTGQ
jgi:phospholipid/cholesterol/gamma-HCH transport system substrate-binding protein